MTDTDPRASILAMLAYRLGLPPESIGSTNRTGHPIEIDFDLYGTRHQLVHHHKGRIVGFIDVYEDAQRLREHGPVYTKWEPPITVNAEQLVNAVLIAAAALRELIEERDTPCP